LRITSQEILETIKMVELEHFDIRTVTMGISLRDCVRPTLNGLCQAIYHKIVTKAANLVQVADELEKEFGIPIINKRISVTPIALLADSLDEDNLKEVAKTLDKAAKEVGVNYIGGFSALVQKGITKGDALLLESIPEALAVTERVCASVNVASTRAGINMDAVGQMGKIIKQTAFLTADKDGLGCAKLVVFCNIPEDNPFMAGALHGIGEAETVINIGVSGPGVVRDAINNIPNKDFGTLAETIKRTAFKITRAGELIGREASKRLGVEFGIVDLSLAPTPKVGDSVAEILEAMGIECCGGPGTTAALALLNDAVKKGGAMASCYVGGLSGAFIPVSEDSGMVRAVKEKVLSLAKLEAMTAVCSVGLDMIALPGDTSSSTLAGLIADEMSIGVINKKTTAVRVIPVPNKKAGDFVEFGGLLGSSPILDILEVSCQAFVERGGRIPAPLQSLIN